MRAQVLRAMHRVEVSVPIRISTRSFVHAAMFDYACGWSDERSSAHSETRLIFMYTCTYCKTSRYPDMTFNPYAVSFNCPRCLGTCNCTQCCAKRGETYISARVGKLPPHGSTEERALIDDALLSNNPRGERMTTPPVEFEMPPPGTFFGVVYGLNGERVGEGYVRKNKKVRVKTGRTPPPKKAVAYIGKKRRPVASTSAAAPTPPSEPPVNVGPSQQKVSNASEIVQSHSSTPQDISSGQANSPIGTVCADDPSRRANPVVSVLKPSRQSSPRGRAYIGKRSVLNSRLYVSMDELIARALRQEVEEPEPEWAEPPSDPMVQDGAGGGAGVGARFGTPPTADVQCAIAIALSALQDMQLSQAATAAAGG